MAGNSQRRGAVRKGASRKGPLVGSGGQKPKGLQGKGPTPKAEDRVKHVAAKRRKAAERRDAALTKGGRAAPSGRGGGGRPPSRQTRGKGSKASSEMVAGRNSVVEALRAQVPVTTMYVASRIDMDDRVREALKAAGELGIPVLETPRGELDRLTDGAIHQGLALQVPPYEYAHPGDLLEAAAEAGEPALIVALDGITDPRNLGAVVRSAAAFGGHGVIVPERRAAGMTASAWKTSAGAASRLPVARATNLTRALEQLQKDGCFVVGLDMDGDVDLPQLAMAHDPIVIVVGSEGKGLSRLVRETCDVIVSIPMHAATESLNAGVAAGVALYEVARRRAHGA
ncbi:23S rRNA (guanosine(2251)-2'-O)-methyltransferase RlmB [Angustibacter sp. Root456]|uniref:23S rRNA (guanosine(2251)-2'-O)-methyltransferase RlmB n=1 Tax=Angustibacter sp. Root456 TaxID=1736539 RepID=UPI0006F701B8|nr:23S rRNA (guanosine(2251)-2'-O)-methyltransferase RlmB [Angustibacter sp. Root456]KQX61568.1 RNA methyltransferase [Angustibacter sp. Root456]